MSGFKKDVRILKRGQDLKKRPGFKKEVRI
jgi:hypothetical protein